MTSLWTHNKVGAMVLALEGHDEARQSQTTLIRVKDRTFSFRSMALQG